MKNFIQPGESVDVVLEDDTASGNPAIVNGALAGIAVTSGVAGDTIAAKRAGIFELPNSGAEFNFGGPVYWSLDDLECVDAPGNNIVYLGRAVAAIAGTAPVLVYIDANLAAPLAAPAVPAAITGGEAPTEAEHNALRAALAAVVADLKARGTYAG